MTHFTPKWFLSYVAIGGLSFAVTGCVNPYQKFYTNTIRPETSRNYLPHTTETEYFSASSPDMKRDVEALERRGYRSVGYVSFNADAKDYTSDLHDKAKEVQADIVLIHSSYMGTRSGVIPLVTYQPGQTSTTYTNGQVQANAYGRGGYAYGTANYSGTSTTTAPGTYNTNFIPYSVERDSYSAVFFRKYHYLFGARWVPLDDEQRRVLQRNTGVVVSLVVEGTPAFLANILPGDILVTMDGETVQSVEWLNRRTMEKAGQNVRWGILRNGSEKVIEVQLNNFLTSSDANANGVQN